MPPYGRIRIIPSGNELSVQNSETVNPAEQGAGDQ